MGPLHPFLLLLFLRSELALVVIFQLQSGIFQEDCPVHKGVEIWVDMSDQLSPQCQIQPFPEAVLLLLVRVDVIHGVAGQLHECPDVLYDSHGS